MSGIKKALIATISAGTLGGTSTGIYFALDNSSPIRQKLRTEGFFVIYDDNSDAWSSILNKYIKASKNVKENSATETLNGLKTKCNIAISNKSSNTKDYLFAKQWCVKEETVTTILRRLKYKVLDFNNNRNIDVDEWRTKIPLVMGATSKYPELKIEISKGSKTEAEKIKLIRGKCEEIMGRDKLTTVEDFGERLKEARELCAVKEDDAK